MSRIETKCPGRICPLKHECKRFLAEPKERQAYHDFTPDLVKGEDGVECPHFVGVFTGVMLY